MRLYTKDEMAAAWDAGAQAYHAELMGEAPTPNPYRPVKADQPAATETAPVCDYWPNGPKPCGRPATHRGRSGTRFLCSCHAVQGDEPLAVTEPQGAPCIHTLNRLGHCTRCGERPKDKL